MRVADTWRLAVEVAAGDAEMAEFVLGEMGALGSVEEDSGRDGTARVTAYFDGRSFQRAGLLDIAREAFGRYPNLAGAYMEVDLEPGRDWNERWREFFKPFAIAEGIVVVPSWERYDASAGETTIEIDPGMAFGTGLHETTSLCAGAIISELARRDPSRTSLVDVGAGSGILAIVARKLGAVRVACVENDPDALAIARANLEKNRCGPVELYADARDAGGSYDIVVANILLGTLLELRQELARLASPGSTLILSGITRDQEGELIEAYGDGFAHLRTEHRGEWSAVTMVARL